MVLDIISNKLNIEMSEISIDWSHRSGKRNSPGQKYKGRHHVFRNKKLLKGSGVFVTESLTLKKMEHLKKVREQHGFANAWTLDGEIIFKGNDGNPKLYYY